MGMEGPKNHQRKESGPPVKAMRQEFDKSLELQRFLASEFPGFKDQSLESAQRKDRFQKTHNNCTVDFFGVAHIPKTWVEQGEDIYKAIEEADAVLVEATPATLPPEEAKRAVESVMKVTQNWYKQDELVTKFSKGVLDSSGMFFEVAAEVALAGGKRVVSADPQSGQSLVENEINIIRRFGERLDTVALLARVVVGSASTLVAVQTLGRLLKEDRSSAKQPDLKTSNRRNFLKFAGATAVTAAAVKVDAGLLPGSTPPVSEGENPSLSLFNRYNYRDLVVAKAVDEFTRQNPGKRLLVLYGMGHVRGIEQYLEKPTAASIKDKLYTLYKSPAEPKMYEYHLDGKKWSQKELFTIQ